MNVITAPAKIHSVPALIVTDLSALQVRKGFRDYAKVSLDDLTTSTRQTNVLLSDESYVLFSQPCAFAPQSNVDSTWYSMERVAVAAGTTACGSSSGSYDVLRYLLISGGQSASAIDPDRPSGTYCYRSAVLGEPTFAYSTPVTITAPQP